MGYWLLKSDIDDYPLERFISDQVTSWDGVRNYQARNFMMKVMKVGDLGIFYHSNAEPSAAVAVLKVASGPKADFLAQRKSSPYFDPKANPQNPIWYCVDVQYLRSFRSPVSLDEMRRDRALENMLLLKRGNRLSILPLKKEEFERICELGEKKSG